MSKLEDASSFCWSAAKAAEKKGDDEPTVAELEKEVANLKKLRSEMHFEARRLFLTTNQSLARAKTHLRGTKDRKAGCETRRQRSEDLQRAAETRLGEVGLRLQGTQKCHEEAKQDLAKVAGKLQDVVDTLKEMADNSLSYEKMEEESEMRIDVAEKRRLGFEKRRDKYEKELKELAIKIKKEKDLLAASHKQKKKQ